MNESFTERERKVLSATIEDFIRTATPVASNRIAGTFDKPLSPATVRNTMALLERGGFLTHPYTSAGKVPTDKGYRTYVNQLMPVVDLNLVLQSRIKQELEEISGNVADYMQVVAHIISQLSHGVGICMSPVNLKALLTGIRLVHISEYRVLFVMEFDSHSMKTVVVELKRNLDSRLLVTVEEILRERLCGVSLEEIEESIVPRLYGTLVDDLGIVSLILEHSEELFTLPLKSELYIYGLQRVLLSPEFGDQEIVTTLAGLVEDEDRLRKLAWAAGDDEKPQITIGSEHQDRSLETFTTISRKFHQHGRTGTLAILAPKRLDYAQSLAVLDFLADTVSEFY